MGDDPYEIVEECDDEIDDDELEEVEQMLLTMTT